MKALKNLGVQSYCFREFKETKKLIECIKACGVTRVELCGAHADFTDEKNFDKTINVFREAGVAIDSIGVQTLKNQGALEAKYFEFARRAGAKFMSVDFELEIAPHCYRTAEKLAEQYGLRVAIHNHGGRHSTPLKI
jgi:hypothetical protein